jgi:hypothetical protein
MFCSGLTTVNQGDGLEEVERNTIRECTLLQRIKIPRGSCTSKGMADIYLRKAKPQTFTHSDEYTVISTNI